MHDQPSEKVKVAIIEDTKAILDNVVKYFTYYDEFQPLDSFISVEDFQRHLEKDKNYKADILLLDIGLPGISGVDAIPLISEKLPDVNIVMLTTYEEEEIILKALCNGAVGYISKRTSLKEIVEAVKVVNKGGSYMSPSIAREIVNHLMGTKKPKKIKSEFLTDRQLEILRLLVDGYSYIKVGKQLDISVQTVKSHIKKIYRQLNVANKAGAVAKFLKGEI